MERESERKRGKWGGKLRETVTKNQKERDLERIRHE